MQGHGYPSPPGFPMMVPGGMYPHVPNGYGLPPSQPMKMPLPSLEDDEDLEEKKMRLLKSRQSKHLFWEPRCILLQLFEKHISSGNPNEEKTDSEKERSRHSNHRERDRKDEGSHVRDGLDEAHDKSLDRDNDRGEDEAVDFKEDYRVVGERKNPHWWTMLSLEMHVKLWGVSFDRRLFMVFRYTVLHMKEMHVKLWGVSFDRRCGRDVGRSIASPSHSTVDVNRIRPSDALDP
ncbi:hypothetical protein QJS10_CPB17g00515 [Acorus calamus]|uniref:Uncharacterized protein n=1 Tax=Acorus calamus TaxID=4465 RepID=A0AAV9CZ41_ACOCL|nr:hypothetical protein QJS10_CPB17g00515 [Acorus calamus]